MRWLFALFLILLFSLSLPAAEPNRFIAKTSLPSGQTILIAEGDFEARSIGSFTVRLYDAAPPEDETTFFSSGLVHKRNGTIEKIVLADIDGNQQPEVIVIVRSAGTGGYLCAHAFAFDEKNLTFRVEVEDLPPESDPVVALQKAIREMK